MSDFETINFGKHKGEKWADLPTSYLTWLARPDSEHEASRKRAERELEARKSLETQKGARFDVDPRLSRTVEQEAITALIKRVEALELSVFKKVMDSKQEILNDEIPF